MPALNQLNRQLQHHLDLRNMIKLVTNPTCAPAAGPSLAESLGRDGILLFVELLVAGALAAALPLTLLLRLAAEPGSAPRRGKMYGALLLTNALEPCFIFAFACKIAVRAKCIVLAPGNGTML